MALDFDNLETYELLVSICAQHQVDPSMSLESENFFRELLANHNGAEDKESVTTWLEELISSSFIALGKRPRWIQNCEWPFLDGTPAIFVGQIDVSTQSSEIASRIFHDDTSVYVFIGKKKAPIVILQQY